MKNIVLIGMPGCGKSTLGRCLAERLGRDFIDADPEIEKDAGKTIPELFAISEDCFRRQETLTTKRLATLQNKVMAMGGGVVLRQAASAQRLQRKRRQRPPATRQRKC